MKMHKKERAAVAQFLADLQSAQESEHHARSTRERLIERTRAEPGRVLDWLNQLPVGRESKSPLLQKLRAIATVKMLEKMLVPTDKDVLEQGPS
jgi:hypothetical protein